MFQEVPFDEEEDVLSNANARPSASTSNQGGSSGQILERFHKPGEPGFCAIAGVQRDTEAMMDTRTVNGDSWVSSECRCTRCECLRFITRTRALETDDDATPLVVVLLDLDNFGFNQLKSIAPVRGEQDTVDALDHIFVWSFFGSCFGRHHHTWPTEETVCARLPNTTSNRQSVWQQLVAGGRTLFTPCSGHCQGADGVIADVLPMVVSKYPVILVSGDRPLLQHFAPPARPIGRKSKRENEDDVLSRRVSLLDVNELEKRFVPFWRSLCRFVAVYMEDNERYA